MTCVFKKLEHGWCAFFLVVLVDLQIYTFSLVSGPQWWTDRKQMIHWRLLFFLTDTDRHKKTSAFRNLTEADPDPLWPNFRAEARLLPSDWKVAITKAKVITALFLGDISGENADSMALCLGQVFSKDKTFRPRKRFEPGTQRFELYKKAQASLKSGLDLRKVVQLPDGENICDWIAVHVVDFFNRINLIYGTMSEFCTERSCPIMSGGLRYEYRWQDGDEYKKPTKLSALKYMNLLMDWIESLINNEDIFPTRVGVWQIKQFGLFSDCVSSERKYLAGVQFLFYLYRK